MVFLPCTAKVEHFWHVRFYNCWQFFFSWFLFFSLTTPCLVLSVQFTNWCWRLDISLFFLQVYIIWVANTNSARIYSPWFFETKVRAVLVTSKGYGFYFSRLSHTSSFLPRQSPILRFFFPSGFGAGKKKTRKPKLSSSPKKGKKRNWFEKNCDFFVTVFFSG